MYKQNGKAALQELCRKNGISSEGKKHECVRRIMEKSGEEQPPSIDAYDGNLISVPESITEIRKLSGYRLREIESGNVKSWKKLFDFPQGTSSYIRHDYSNKDINKVTKRNVF